MNASARFMARHPAHWVALGFGSGLSPLAPGTVGTLWGWLAFVVFDRWLGPWQWGVVIALALAVGAWACTRTARALQVPDPGAIVWDEIVAFWIVLLVFAASALRILGGTLFERWTESLLGYLPSAIGGVIIIVLGFTGGSLARNVLEQASLGLGVGQSSFLGKLAQAVLVLSGVVIGIDQLGVNVNFLIQLTTVTAAAVFGGIALVFALGTRQHLANLIGAHYARKHYAPGDHVKIGAFEGRVLEISDGCVFIETEQGDVSVPGEHFTQQPFVKLRKNEIGRAHV